MEDGTNKQTNKQNYFFLPPSPKLPPKNGATMSLDQVAPEPPTSRVPPPISSAGAVLGVAARVVLDDERQGRDLGLEGGQGLHMRDGSNDHGRSQRRRRSSQACILALSFDNRGLVLHLRLVGHLGAHMCCGLDRGVRLDVDVLLLELVVHLGSGLDLRALGLHAALVHGRGEYDVRGGGDHVRAQVRGARVERDKARVCGRGDAVRAHLLVVAALEHGGAVEGEVHHGGEGVAHEQGAAVAEAVQGGRAVAEAVGAEGAGALGLDDRGVGLDDGLVSD